MQSKTSIKEQELSIPLAGGLPIGEKKSAEMVKECERLARKASKAQKHLEAAQHLAAAVLFSLQSERIDYTDVMRLLQSVRDEVCLRSSQPLRDRYAASKPKTRAQMREERDIYS